MPSDRKIAEKWFKKAAALGNSQAKNSLQELERLQKVFLVINKKGHSGIIYDLLFSNDGKFLISASSDKTIDVWDSKTGKNIRTISGEIGSGNDGSFSVLALSPDGKLLAAGGRFPGSTGSIRIYNLETGDIEKVLIGHTWAIYDIAFSSDGKHLLTCSDDDTARVWNMLSGKSLYSLPHDDSVRQGIFIEDDKILVTAAGANLYWWNIQNGKRIRKINASNKKITLLLSSPDGNIATSDTAVFFKGWNGRTGKLLSTTKAFSSIINITFDKLGDRFLWNRQDRFSVRSLKSKKDLFFTDLGEEGKSSSFSASTISPNGKKAAIGYSNGKIILFDVDEGKTISELSPPVSRIKQVAFSADGSKLIWHQKEKNYAITLLDKKKQYKLGAVIRNLSDKPILAEQKNNVKGWQITFPNKENEILEIRNNKKLVYSIQASGEFSEFHDTQITPDGKTVITYNGGNIITSYDVITGDRLWQRPFDAATGLIEDIAVSPDSHLLAVGESDQTIKLYNIKTGTLCLTLFFDGKKEWIAWNPDGYYTGSLGGDQLISWHLNQGPEKAALRFPARQFSKQFYSPLTISETLAGNKHSETVAQNISSTKKKKKIKSITKLIPPVVSFLEPTERTITVSSSKLRIKGKAVSSNSEPITDIWVLVNGRRAETSRKIVSNPKSIKKIDGLLAEIDIMVNLSDEHTIVSLIASNRYSQSSPLMFEVNKPDKSLHTQLDRSIRNNIKIVKPNLYILAVGVSEYKQREISLNFAHKDAEGVANVFAGQNGKLYEHVYQRVLTNDNATRNNILDGLEWLMKEATQKDITILFIAGHGQKDLSGNYYFLPYDVDVNALRRSGLRWDEFNDVLYQLPSKIILMADTCHSGAITGKTHGGDISNVLQKLVSSGGGIVVLTASTGDEVSVERSDWGHGAFSKAIIEGLQGKADYIKDNIIGMKELDLYINSRVKELTAGKQHATTEIPRVLPDFELIAL